MHRAIAALIAISVFVNVMFHVFLAGWQPDFSPPSSPATTTLGFVHNATDNLTYISWVQQASHGIYPFSNLYTTSPHASLLITPFFLFAGHVGGWCSLSPILLFNIIALVSIPAFIFFTAGTCRKLGFSSAISAATVVLVVSGGGLSWLLYILNKAGLSGLLRLSGGMAPDLFYHDLYPLTAFITYPYHAFSLALLALLVYLIVIFENSGRRLSHRAILILFGTSFALSATRPYEPAILFVAYACATALSFAVRAPRAIILRRAALLGCLAAGILPLALYHLWISTQPVWSNFAASSLGLHGVQNWAAAFALLWILGLVGVVACIEKGQHPALLFFVVWFAIVAILLLVLQSGLTKLCGGATIPLGILSGAGLAYLSDKIQRPKFQVLTLCIIAGVSLLSPALVHYQLIKKTPRCDAELLRAIDHIPRPSREKVPTVLTDSSSGSYLPGLAGCRVYCGHWALTDNYHKKTQVLSALGIAGAEYPDSISPDIAPDIQALADQVSSGSFDYFLVRKDAALFRGLDADPERDVLYEGERYYLARMDERLAQYIAKKLRTIANELTR
jgi:hypothetical protein